MQRINRLRITALLAVATGALATIGGCSALQTPQQACLAPETTNTIAGLLTEGAAEGAVNAVLLTGKMPDLKTLPDVVQGLWKRGLISIDEVTLKSFDKDTKLVRCSGVLKMNLKAGVREAPNHPPLGALAGDEADVPITYERQPEANGARFVYRIDAVGDYQTTMLLMAASQGAPPTHAVATTTDAAEAGGKVEPGETVNADAELAAIPIGAPTSPPFETYPATPFNGPVVMPDYTGDGKNFADYRTRLDQAAKGGPNFAGEVALAQWGCGTECSDATAVDLKTGKIYNFPLGGEDNLMLDLKFTPTSNLVAANWQSADDSKGQHYCVSESYLWTGSGFTEIAKSKQLGDCPL